MAESSVDPETDWGSGALDSAEADDILVAMETLLATLRAFEDVLRHQEVTAASSTEYCDNFCQALMHYAGSRNSVEHGLPLLEVYCLSINCFAAARSHLTAESDSVALVLKRLALSCFELLLSVSENDIPYEAWVQFHNSVQIAHDTLRRFGSTDLQALLQITGEGGAWSNPVLTALLTGQHTNPEEVNAYISLEGEGFMEMRVKHLEKINEVAKAVVLAKACSECCLISNQATFRNTYVSLLCHLLPNEEAITEISRLDCKDVLEITCNLEKEADENTAFILCTTFLTQQLQQPSLHCSWELTLLWSKLQRKIDPSLESLLERCLQLGAIAKTVQHLLFLVRVIRAETEELGRASSVELCVKALQLPKQNDSEPRISVCQAVSCLLSDDLEVSRACLLTEFLLGPCQEVFCRLEEIYLRPDQKYELEHGRIPNSLRCELLLTLKAYWPFDPEFWDWKTLKYQCVTLLGMTPDSEEDEEDKNQQRFDYVTQGGNSTGVKGEELDLQHHFNGVVDGHEEKRDSGKSPSKKESALEMEKHKFRCKICRKYVSKSQTIHHSKRHAAHDTHPCPICLERFQSRKELVPHIKEHVRKPADFDNDYNTTDELPNQSDEEDDIEPGEIKIDPSLMLYYQSTHDPDVLHHIVQQAKSVNGKCLDDEHITFDYIDINFKLQNRDEYPCPGTNCTKIFKHSKYLYVHLNAEHKGDENVKHFHTMRDRREKCLFCRRHFVSPYHHRKHRRLHFNDEPYMCTVIGCGAQFPSSNELVTHKQIHGYQLSYQCELKGCYATFSDLGQLYHHEAQHFRDAAFSCTSPECKKFYLSKKEFLDHLSTHGITFSEEDFETQRKAKQKFFNMIKQETIDLKKSGEPVPKRVVIGDDLTSSTSCVSPLPPSGCKGPKGMITAVAVCFDGSKFTCGFEKCGMTFSRARDVQRHFKCAHPEHLKLENKEDRHDKEHDSKFKGQKVKTEPTSPEKGNSFSPQGAGQETKDSHQLNRNGNDSSNLSQNNALRDILTRLSELDLNSAGSRIVPPASSNSSSESNKSYLSLYRSAMANTPIVLLQKRPDISGDTVKVGSIIKTENIKVGSGELMVTAKPYICQIQDCDFRTAQSFSLLRHYVYRHGHSVQHARKLTSWKTTSFKPYVCHICSRSHREKRVLRAHYIQMHKFTEAAFEKIFCATVPHNGSVTTQSDKQTPQPHSKDVPSPQQRCQKIKVGIVKRENGKHLDKPPPSEKEEIEEAEKRGGRDVKEPKVESDDRTPRHVRTTRRLLAKSNMCYILTKFNKPFHCVAKDCNAAFSTQGGLVRHLQLVHQYNRSQLVLENDLDVQQNADVRKDPAKNRPVSSCDEPQPQYKCHFANCKVSYHLKSSLVRHTRDVHSQPEPIRCKYEGCARVFNLESALKKHILYTHCEYYNSLVLRLQSTHKKSISGCQKKLVLASPSPQKEELNLRASQLQAPGPKTQQPSTGAEFTEEKIKVSRSRSPIKQESTFSFRSHEEAFQMCQDRGLRLAYPCMVQGCVSVVRYLKSLHRHYHVVHSMERAHVLKNKGKLFFSAEALEELIQQKSAQPAVDGDCAPGGGHKKEPSKPSPMNFNAIKGEILDGGGQDPLHFPEEELPPMDRNILVGADDVLYGEPSTGGHKEEPATTMQNGCKPEWPKWHTNPTLPAVTIDLSPPSSLRFTGEESFQDTSGSKDSGKMMKEYVSASNPLVRQPLKRKNELSEHPSNVKDAPPHFPPSHSFDIATYKPMGFESSFLKFIQETKEDDMTPVKHKDSFKHSWSVKENKQSGVSHTRRKSSRSPPLKALAMTEDFTSVKNLKSIMDKALAGCGDLAIKQLQYLRPVVVLERPVYTSTPTNLFLSDTNGELLLGN